MAQASASLDHVFHSGSCEQNLRTSNQSNVTKQFIKIMIGLFPSRLLLSEGL